VIDAFGAAGWDVPPGRFDQVQTPVHLEFGGNQGWGSHLALKDDKILLSCGGRANTLLPSRMHRYLRGMHPDKAKPLHIDEVFTVVRSPHYRLRSTCMRHIRTRHIPTLDLAAENIINECKVNRHHLDNHTRPQTELLPDLELAKEISLKVYKFESISHHKEIALLAGHTGTWPRVGADLYSIHSIHSEIMFSEPVLELIYDFYREDYERYGYLRYLL